MDWFGAFVIAAIVGVSGALLGGEPARRVALSAVAAGLLGMAVKLAGNLLGVFLVGQIAEWLAITLAALVAVLALRLAYRVERG